jgi:hypothetical protein
VPDDNIYYDDEPAVWITKKNASYLYKMSLALIPQDILLLASTGLALTASRMALRSAAIAISDHRDRGLPV